MKIRMKSLMAGPDGIYHPGQEVEVADDLAKALIKAGYAEEIILSDIERRKDVADDEGIEAAGDEASQVRETAAVEPPEQAVTPKKTRKRRKPGESARRKA